MKIGVFATFMSPLATPEMVADLGRRIEGAGLESLWMGEHVVLFDEMEFPYPGSRDGRIPVPEGGGMLDTVATFGFLANATSTLSPGTALDTTTASGGSTRVSRRGSSRAEVSRASLPPTCLASCPTKHVAPASRTASSCALAFASEPDTR